LGLYNLAYMLDDSLMLTVAVVTLVQRKLQEQEGRWQKLVSGVVMLGLAVVLIAKLDWLRAWALRTCWHGILLFWRWCQRERLAWTAAPAR
jgi:hypothetical protein